MVAIVSEKIYLGSAKPGSGGGSTPVIDELNVTPSTSAQTITAPSGVDGYSPVNVSAVDASIDENITAGNIKSGVSILGVAGSVTELNGSTTTINPSTSSQTVTPTSPSNGFTSVTVPAVTAAIDANIAAGNIKKDVQILGVTGSYEGVVPSGTKPITTNGIHDVAGYANADVQVPTTAPAHYIEKAVDANGKLINAPNIINFNGVTDVGEYALYGQYYGAIFPSNTSIDLSSLTAISGSNACREMFTVSRNITSVDLSSLTTIGNYACQSMFSSCNTLTSVDLSSLTTISSSYACQSMFSGCSALPSIDLSSLTTISGASGCNTMFSGCTSLASVDLSGLTTITGNSACTSMFLNCTSLTTMKLNALNTITKQIAGNFGYMFGGCTHLESVEFGGLTASTFASVKNQFQYLFNDTTGSQATGGCTVHFPSNFDPTDPDHTFDVTTLTGYPTFSGSASYIHVAFDLPATE